MQPAIRYARYLAFAWIPLALVAAALIEHPGWTIGAVVSAVAVPFVLVMVATVLDRNGPHRPDSSIRRSPARSA